ncbi:MAG: porin [Candidatus Manganitrophaceae bacterium]
MKPEMKQKMKSVWVILFLIMTVGSVRAEEPAKSSVKISGFVDTYYSFNFNRPDSNKNTIGNTDSNFDFNHNTFSLNLAELVFQKTADSSDPVGFRVDLNFGPTTDFVHGGPFGKHPQAHPSTTEAETFKNIQQAYVTWATPTGITLEMGKFVTHMGAEVIESKDNWNYTRSLLFCCAIPYYHSGLRANYVISEMLYVTGYLYNGWNNVIETNNQKTFGAQIGFTPVKRLPIVFNWIGPEGGPTDSIIGGSSSFKSKQVYDLVATYNATDSLAFMVNYDYGTQDAVPTGDRQRYSGVAAYARWAATDSCALAVRYENVNDKDDILFVSGQQPKVQEVTLTGEHKVAGSLLLRVEYRHDRADKKIFEEKGGNKTDTQNRLIAGVVYTF